MSYRHISSIFLGFQILVAILFLGNVKISPLEEELCELVNDRGK